MTWTNDYETLTAMRNTSTEKVKAIINRALEYAKNNLTNGWDKLDDDFIIINVEGFPCVALVTNEWQPLEICERVFPFDSERIYPMQEIEQKIYFKQY
jgi:hypothetical protein